MYTLSSRALSVRRFQFSERVRQHSKLVLFSITHLSPFYFLPLCRFRAVRVGGSITSSLADVLLEIVSIRKT